MNGVLLLLSPMTWFVLHPWRVVAVIVVMLSPEVLPVRARLSPRRQLLMFVCIVPWVLFAYTEATTSPTSNIRVDLVLTVPVCMIALVVWATALTGGLKPRRSGE